MRVFGAIKAAGTRIEEQTSGKQIARAPLGWVGYAGIFEKGPVDELVVLTRGSQLEEVMGGVIDESLAPDAAEQFFKLANGAGGMLIKRVTDGTERVASLNLYTRNAEQRVLLGRIDAQNGGRWGGKKATYTDAVDDEAVDITETTLQMKSALVTTLDLKEDQLVGAVLNLDGVANSAYEVVGNTANGLISVSADQTMATDLAGGGDPTNDVYYLTLANDGKALSVEITDGEVNPLTEFTLSVFIDGAFWRAWKDISTDPTHSRYWKDVINQDDANTQVTAVDSFTGAHVAGTRPANSYGLVVSVAANVLTVDIHDSWVVSSSDPLPNPTVALGTVDADHQEQVLTCTMTSATAFDVSSSKYGALGSGTIGVEFDAARKFVPPFTVTNGGTVVGTADLVVIDFKPMIVDALIGGRLFPNKGDSPNLGYLIADNSHNTVTVQQGVDLTAETATDKEFMVAYAQELANGRDGHAGVADGDYIAAWDPETSLFNDARKLNLGLIKFATPGVTATAVQKAGVAFAAAKNHQYRVEVPSNLTTDNGALEYLNDTIGRSDYQVQTFPSYIYVPHPEREAQRAGRKKLISATGEIHGREARMAADYFGYHKAAAGVEATLPDVVELPTGERELDEERLNPAGFSVIVKKQGNYVIWGDRTASTSSEWKFKHKREQMSHYEQELLYGLDGIIFALNDPESDGEVYAMLRAFFDPEWAKRAIVGSTPEEAAIIKIDADLNTPTSRADGDKIAAVKLRLADTTERMIIRIGQQGVSEATA